MSFIYLYGFHDKVNFYFWPNQGMGLSTWKNISMQGKWKFYKYRGYHIEWAHGQTWNEKSEIITLWHWPRLRFSKFEWVGTKKEKP